MLIPALFTNMLRCEYFSQKASENDLTDLSEERSRGCRNVAFPNDFSLAPLKLLLIRSADDCPLSRDLQARMTVYPCSTNEDAVSNPIPVLEPVTIATEDSAVLKRCSGRIASTLVALIWKGKGFISNMARCATAV